MNAIEKTIFDTLAAGRGINLPGIGALRVERVPAQFLSGRSLRPPHNRVVFTPKTNPSYPSAGDMPGYEAWLAHGARNDGIREIGGVGVLRGNTFYPAAELHDLLNPQGTEPVAVKPRTAFWKKALVGAGVLAVAALVLAAVITLSDFAERKTGARTAPDAALIAEEANEGAASRGESTIAPVVTGEIEEELAAAGEAASGPANAADRVPALTETVPEMPSSSAEGNDTAIADKIKRRAEEYAAGPSARSPEYHLVAGVFSEPENADRLIARDPLGIGSANYRKVDFGQGRTLVSACSSTDRTVVETRRRELQRINAELWVYETK
ncbi:MAG TPA: hypothetical protein H9866_07075 [Candidatus Tidjanibacter gallistercoris]|nr:hypothetical protein [Candidatus Tidjanibacter gallistercoris]